ncbi:hypothetical protein BJ742DRAFT_793691 [Cladochytrium replicatum]|nr:hypothetical protein BJ742DRAFT_793691 [Cladochytrium replicatum]
MSSNISGWWDLDEIIAGSDTPPPPVPKIPEAYAMHQFLTNVMKSRPTSAPVAPSLPPLHYTPYTEPNTLLSASTDLSPPISDQSRHSRGHSETLASALELTKNYPFKSVSPSSLSHTPTNPYTSQPSFPPPVAPQLPRNMRRSGSQNRSGRGDKRTTLQEFLLESRMGSPDGSQESEPDRGRTSRRTWPSVLLDGSVDVAEVSNSSSSSLTSTSSPRLDGHNKKVSFSMDKNIAYASEVRDSKDRGVINLVSKFVKIKRSTSNDPPHRRQRDQDALVPVVDSLTPRWRPQPRIHPAAMRFPQYLEYIPPNQDSSLEGEDSRSIDPHVHNSYHFSSGSSSSRDSRKLEAMRRQMSLQDALSLIHAREDGGEVLWNSIRTMPVEDIRRQNIESWENGMLSPGSTRSGHTSYSLNSSAGYAQSSTAGSDSGVETGSVTVRRAGSQRTSSSGYARSSFVGSDTGFDNANLTVRQNGVPRSSSRDRSRKFLPVNMDSRETTVIGSPSEVQPSFGYAMPKGECLLCQQYQRQLASSSSLIVGSDEDPEISFRNPAIGRFLVVHHDLHERQLAAMARSNILLVPPSIIEEESYRSSVRSSVRSSARSSLLSSTLSDRIRRARSESPSRTRYNDSDDDSFVIQRASGLFGHKAWGSRDNDRLFAGKGDNLAKRVSLGAVGGRM